MALGNRLLFSAKNRTNGVELWSSEGTVKGTRLLLDACPGECSSAETRGTSQPGPAAWVPEQGLLYFSSEIPGQGHGVELWRSDGTPGGTYEEPEKTAHRLQQVVAFHGTSELAEVEEDRVADDLADVDFPGLRGSHDGSILSSIPSYRRISRLRLSGRGMERPVP